MICQIYHFLRNLKGYYYLDKIFDLHNSKNKNFVATLILIRLTQALSIVLLRHQPLVSIIILISLQALLSIGFTILRPYTKNLYNILNIIA